MNRPFSYFELTDKLNEFKREGNDMWELYGDSFKIALIELLQTKNLEDITYEDVYYYTINNLQS